MDLNTIIPITILVSIIIMSFICAHVVNKVVKNTINQIESQSGPSIIRCYYSGWSYSFLQALLCAMTIGGFTAVIATAKEGYLPGAVFAIFCTIISLGVTVFCFIVPMNRIMLLYEDKVIHRSMFSRRFEEYYFVNLRALYYPSVGPRSGKEFKLYFTNGEIASNSFQKGTYDAYLWLRKYYGNLEGRNQVVQYYKEKRNYQENLR